MSTIRPRTLSVCTLLAPLAAASALQAGILAVHWKAAGPDTWELYAELEPAYRLTNADLADSFINELPDGVNHGLFVSDGSILTVTLTIGNTPGIPLRPPTFDNILTGQQLDAAWFVFGGVFCSVVDGTTAGTINAVRVLTVQTTPGAKLGGVGPDSITPSRIFLFANNTTPGGTTLGVFNIPPIPGCTGDINSDNLVNLADFNILAVNFGAGPGATLSQGDLNNDGFVNLADFNILAVNFGADCN